MAVLKKAQSLPEKNLSKQNRSNHRRCSLRKGVLRNFAKFTRKHLCQSLFFNKAADLRPKACNFFKKETLEQVFSCEFCEISQNTFCHRTAPVSASGDCWLVAEHFCSQWCYWITIKGLAFNYLKGGPSNNMISPLHIAYFPLFLFFQWSFKTNISVNW